MKRCIVAINVIVKTSSSSVTILDVTCLLESKWIHVFEFEFTGREQLIRGHLSARFCFKLSGNSN